MIRPVVEFMKEYWYIEAENDRLVNVKDTKVCLEMDKMTKEELEELSEAVLMLEREVADCMACVDGAMDVLDYNEGFGTQKEQITFSNWKA